MVVSINIAKKIVQRDTKVFLEHTLICNVLSIPPVNLQKFYGIFKINSVINILKHPKTNLKVRSVLVVHNLLFGPILFAFFLQMLILAFVTIFF